MKRFLIAIGTLALASVASASAVSQDSADELDRVDQTTIVSQTQSGRLQVDSNGRPSTLMDGSKLMGQFVYDSLGRLSEIRTVGGSRIFQYGDESMRPAAAWVSKSGGTQPWRSAGISEAGILDTIAAFNQAPLQVMTRVHALVETTMLSALSAEMQQMYRKFGAQKKH